MLSDYEGCGRSWCWGPRKVGAPFTLLDSSSPPTLAPGQQHTQHAPTSGAYTGFPSASNSAPTSHLLSTLPSPRSSSDQGHVIFSMRPSLTIPSKLQPPALSPLPYSVLSFYHST